MMAHKIKLMFAAVLVGVFVLSSVKFFCGDPVAQAISGLDSGPRAMITLTFDDGNIKIWDNALPAMSARNIKGVLFGETGPLNSGEDWVVTWDQVRALQNKYGWEIGSHSITHPYLTRVSDEQLIKELLGSKLDFAAQGINVKGFATPYGDYDSRVLVNISQYYDYHRAAWGGPNAWPYNKYEILALEVSHTTSPEQVKQWINSAIANKQWLVLLFHEIVSGTAGEYQYNLNKFTKILDTIKTSQISVVTMGEILGLTAPTPSPPPAPQPPTPSPPGGSYITDWQPSNANYVSVNKGAVKIVGGATLREAVSGQIAVSASGSYTLKMNQSVTDRRAGGWAVWVDEFDSSGRYVSGKWLGGNYANFSGVRTYSYKPSTSKVVRASFLIFTEKNSKLTLNFNSAQLVKIK